MAYRLLLDPDWSQSEEELTPSSATEDSEDDSRYYLRTEQVESSHRREHGSSNNENDSSDIDNFGSDSDSIINGALQPRPVDAQRVFNRAIVDWWHKVVEAHGITHGDYYILYRECTGETGLELLYAIYRLNSEPKQCLGHVRYYATADGGHEAEGAIELVARATPAKFETVEGGRAPEPDPRSNSWATDVMFPARRGRLVSLFVRKQVSLCSSTSTTSCMGSLVTQYPGTDFDDGVMQAESTFPEAVRPLSREDVRFTIGGSDDPLTSAFARPLTGLTRADFVEFIMMSLFLWQIDPESSISTPYGDIIFTSSLVGRLYHDGLLCTCPTSLAEVPTKSLRYCYNVPRNPNDHLCPRERESRAVIQIWGELCKQDPNRFIPKMFDMLLDSRHCADVQGACEYMELPQITKVLNLLFKTHSSVLFFPSEYKRQISPSKLADRARTLRFIECRDHEVSDTLWQLLQKTGYIYSTPKPVNSLFASAEYQLFRCKMYKLFQRELLCLLRCCMMNNPATASFQIKLGQPETVGIVYTGDGLLLAHVSFFSPMTAESRLAAAHWVWVDFPRPKSQVVGMAWKDHLLAANVAMFLFRRIYDIALKEQGQILDDDFRMDYSEEMWSQRAPILRQSAEVNPYPEAPAVTTAKIASRHFRVDVSSYIQMSSTFALSAFKGCSGKGQLSLQCDWAAAGCNADDMVEYHVHNAETCQALRYLNTVLDAVHNGNFGCLDRWDSCALPPDPLNPVAPFANPALLTRHGCARVVYPAGLSQALFVGLNPDTWYFGVAINHARPAHPVLVTAWPCFPRHDGDPRDETAHFDELERQRRRFRGRSCTSGARSDESGGQGDVEGEDEAEAHDEPEGDMNFGVDKGAGKDIFKAMGARYLEHEKPAQWQGLWPEQAGDKAPAQRIVTWC